MNSGIVFFKEGLTKKQQLFPRHTLFWRIALAAVDTLVYLYPDKEKILHFLNVARSTNYILNDELEIIKTQLRITLANRPEELAGILMILEKANEKLKTYVNTIKITKMQFKSSKDELQWLRKDHARLQKIVNDARTLLT